MINNANLILSSKTAYRARHIKEGGTNNMAGFQKAKREKIWLKILLGGASGSGKSYSALRLATGIAKKGKGKVAAIDTEAGRIRYYANEFDFDDLQLDEPYTPEKYINAIDEAIECECRKNFPLSEYA